MTSSRGEDVDEDVNVDVGDADLARKLLETMKSQMLMILTSVTNSEMAV